HGPARRDGRSDRALARCRARRAWRRRLQHQRAGKRRAGRVRRHLFAARRQRTRRREASAAIDDDAGGAFSGRHGVVGALHDDAIVVVEAAPHRIDQEHVSPDLATKEAMADVGGPVIAIALSLAAVFIPVAFLGGLTGQLYKQFALTLATSVLLSAIVALTLTPALCALLLRPARHSEHPGPLARFFELFNRLFESFRNHYTDSVVTLARHAALVALTFVVLLGALYGLIKTRPTGLVPDEDQGYMFVILQLPPGASLERTN